jgi:hypothetical protein
MTPDIPLFTFGKYRNRRIDDIVRADPGYAVWAYETVRNSGVTEAQYREAKANAWADKAAASWHRELNAGAGYGPRYDKDLGGPEEYRRAEPEREPVYFADGSGCLPARGPCGPLYFDRNGET